MSYYIDDVVNALVAAATAEGVNRFIINVGSGEETSINELVKKVARVTEREIPPSIAVLKAGVYHASLPI